MPNPFDEINSRLIRMEKMLKNLPSPSPDKNVDLFRFMPVKDIFKNKICGKATFYAHLKNHEFTLYKFGKSSFVDRQEFEKAFRPVILRKVA